MFILIKKQKIFILPSNIMIAYFGKGIFVNCVNFNLHINKYGNLKTISKRVKCFYFNCF